MKTLLQRRGIRVLSSVVVACFLSAQVAAWFPATAWADASDDLKEIEYKYYFRGAYDKAIDALNAFLERDGLSAPQIVEAREYLAASLILSGAVAAGKAQFLTLLNGDAMYGGPDPAVFKAVIVSAFEDAKAEYASTLIRTVPDTAMSVDVPSEPPPPAKESKAVYKKWWFYATMAGVVLVIAAASGGGSGEEEKPNEQGTVSVDIDVR